eukprot:Unigene7287_Nuclearia_a/m.22377 Unigene7287_Nuclearia_a/g.22377  ORF Unigene7287_Nuclearia_a/g.22377 Unigene7287_Nuclearia_a/m.22377 type:complete len:448 (-) Unigene7287_Nuclearia_a:56-1399(-)
MRSVVVLLVAIAVAAAHAQRITPALPLREQSQLMSGWLNERLYSVLPGLMREQNVSMWLISQREYAEDTVFFSIKAPTQFWARRRTLDAFYFDRAGAFARATYVQITDEVWDKLRALVEAQDPATIALNIDGDWAFADGLHAGEREELEAALGPYAARVVRRPMLAVDYVATRLESMLPVYRELMETAWGIIREGFSSLTPNVTTTDDLVWWFRERIQANNMSTWFQPSVDIQRRGYQGGGVIQRGDMLWCDFGLAAYGLHTDTQHNAYVLQEGEIEPPAGLLAGLRDANALQDITRAAMVVGRSGNVVLADALAAMRAAGIEGTVYSHPIGDHGHGAGPLIGMWDLQQGVPVRGDALLRPQTWFSVELMVRVRSLSFADRGRTGHARRARVGRPGRPVPPGGGPLRRRGRRQRVGLRPAGRVPPRRVGERERGREKERLTRAMSAP